MLPDCVLLRADEGGVEVLDDENRRDPAVGPAVAPIPVAVGLRAIAVDSVLSAKVRNSTTSVPYRALSTS